MDKQITIITVTYNSAKNIIKYLNALVKNKQYIHEAIIIENNSLDKEVIKKKCLQYKNLLKIKFIINDNVGFGKSCNIGALKSKSNYLLFLNPDTELQKNSLKILLDHAQQNNADIIGGKAINYKGKIHESVVRLPNLLTGIFEFSNLGKIFSIKTAHEQFYYEDQNILQSKFDRSVDAISGAYLLIKRKSFKKLGGFDNNIFMYLEDVDLCKRANDLNMNVLFCPHSKIWHIGGASSKNKYRIEHQAWFDSRKYYFKKHFGFFTNIIIQPLFSIEEYLLKRLKSI